ncbi:MAG: hypothetical protein KKI08_22810 [Armatimonadetes bacterium]|nr:hypothetical protein [Armatimonadota bacterium]
MRTISLDEELKAVVPSPPAGDRPRGRRKPRDPDESAALIALVRARWDLYVASGQLEIIEPRLWRLHLGEDRVREYQCKQSPKGSDA